MPGSPMPRPSIGYKIDTLYPIESQDFSKERVDTIPRLSAFVKIHAAIVERIGF